jgi:hypothetical protein
MPYKRWAVLVMFISIDVSDMTTWSSLHLPGIVSFLAHPVCLYVITDRQSSLLDNRGTVLTKCILSITAILESVRPGNVSLECHYHNRHMLDPANQVHATTRK